MRLSDNADLGSGFGLSWMLPTPYPLRDVHGRLRSEGSDVTVLTPDAGAFSAIALRPRRSAHSRGPTRPDTSLPFTPAPRRRAHPADASHSRADFRRRPPARAAGQEGVPLHV